MPRFPRVFPRVHPLSASVGAPFGGGARPFQGFRLPALPIPKPVIWSETPEYADGRRLGAEDVRRARAGAVVYMPNWIRTAGGAYGAGYSVGVSEAGGSFIAESPLRIRIVVPTAYGTGVEILADRQNGVRVAQEDAAKGRTWSPDFRIQSDEFRYGYGAGAMLAGLCFTPDAPVDGRFWVVKDGDGYRPGGVSCNVRGTPLQRLYELYPSMPRGAPGHPLPGESLVQGFLSLF